VLQQFVDGWMKNKELARKEFSSKVFNNYDEIVLVALKYASLDVDEYDAPDLSKMTVLDHGHYQGTRLFIFPKNRYQPSSYFWVMVNYGSCSGCDTLCAINNYTDDGLPDQKMVDGYMTLALHIVQGLSAIGE